MANTVIQLKYSTVTATPSALNVAEPAYSYTSNTLFIGSPTGTGAIAIGGKFYLDQQQIIYDFANAAYAQANAAGTSSTVNAAFEAANTAGIYANGSFAAANSAGSYANSGFIHANSAFIQSNSAFDHANAAFASANNEAGVNATQNNSIAAAFAAANSSGSYGNTSFIHANAAFEAANSAGIYANGAFTRANNSLNANTGGTVTGSLSIFGGDLSVTGNLIVYGNSVTQNVTTLNIADPLIYLAANNYASDIVDIGFVANYYDGANQRHTGVFRDAGNKQYYIFDNYDKEPDANNLIDINDASFRVATLHANLISQTITLNNQDLQLFISGAYYHANSAYDSANNINGVNLTQNNSIAAAFTAANSAGVYANGAFIHANSGFDAANTADAKAVASGNYANAAFITANAAQAHAEAAFSLANGTAIIANTDYTTITTTGGHYGNGATISSFTLEANGRISQANSTLIGISASQVTVGTLPVARGGTGAGTFTTNGVLLGQGTGAFTTASSSTEGHVLTINPSGVPTFMHLQGGTF